jgi:hypothetical protein
MLRRTAVIICESGPQFELSSFDLVHQHVTCLVNAQFRTFGVSSDHPGKKKKKSRKLCFEGFEKIQPYTVSFVEKVYILSALIMLRLYQTYLMCSMSVHYIVQKH